MSAVGHEQQGMHTSVSIKASASAFQLEPDGSNTWHTQPAQPASPAANLAGARDTAGHAARVAAGATQHGQSDEVPEAETEASTLAPLIRTSAATEPARCGSELSLVCTVSPGDVLLSMLMQRTSASNRMAAGAGPARAPLPGAAHHTAGRPQGPAGASRTTPHGTPACKPVSLPAPPRSAAHRECS